MKHAKKSILVPENEYLALLRMLKGGGDYLQNERSNIEGKIQQNLMDPKIGSEIKGKRHDWLYKKRRQLKEIEENRPQKVTIQNAEAISSSLAPYLGIKKPSAELEDSVPKRAKNVRVKKPRKMLETSQSEYRSMESSAAENGASENESAQKTPIAKGNIFGSSRKTSPSNYSKLVGIVSKNRDKYGINSDGQILTNFGAPIKNSSYTDAIKYMTGTLDSPPKGYKFFMSKINKDNEISKFFKPQQGEGKRVLVKIKSIKTKGLARMPIKKPFKPVLWAKL